MEGTTRRPARRAKPQTADSRPGAIAARRAPTVIVATAAALLSSALALLVPVLPGAGLAAAHASNCAYGSPLQASGRNGVRQGVCGVHRGRLHKTSPPPPAQRTLTVSTSGPGTVSGPGINCPGDCSQTYSDGASVTLSASVTDGSSFRGWTGACSGSGTCQLTMGFDQSVGAAFDSGSPPPPPPPPPGDSCGWGILDATTLPGACWRPYSDSSPWNTPILGGTPTQSDSARLVANLGSPAAGQSKFGDPDLETSNQPVYWSVASGADPMVTVECTDYGRACPVQGLQVPLAPGAALEPGRRLERLWLRPTGVRGHDHR